MCSFFRVLEYTKSIVIKCAQLICRNGVSSFCCLFVPHGGFDCTFLNSIPCPIQSTKIKLSFSMTRLGSLCQQFHPRFLVSKHSSPVKITLCKFILTIGVVDILAIRLDDHGPKFTRIAMDG